MSNQQDGRTPEWMAGLFLALIAAGILGFMAQIDLSVHGAVEFVLKTVIFTVVMYSAFRAIEAGRKRWFA